MVISQRPKKVVLIVGTDTEVGKTWIAHKLLDIWRELGISVSARKPAQSFCKGSWPTDADVLAAASGELPEDVCPKSYWYPLEMAPPMAAEALGLEPPTLAGLVSSASWPSDVNVGLVESAGGVRSPQAVDGDAVDLARMLQPQGIVLVSHAGLGCINSVRLSHDAIAGISVEGGEEIPIFTVLNRFETGNDLHRRNLEWLRERYAIQVRTGLLDDIVALGHELVADVTSG
ncbi:MAG: dethiobiotin synthase [Actinobacteria bacterium]|jgi:dethiobiotin synthetase|nr:dethiobiotin synthase [Actinomycetota bacterium]MCL5446450.1 dethiobiotin synthase [Actinomycetota bacterium]